MLKSIEKYFPYKSWRRFQKEIAENVYNGLYTGSVVLIEAPTGIGKTASVLAASLAYAEETGKKILYLVRTKSEAQAPIREFKKLIKKSIDIRYIVIRSRLDMCCIVESKKLPYEEFIEECRYLRSYGKCQYYINTQKISEDELLTKLTDLIPEYTFKKFIEYSCSCNLCPYEFAKKILNNVDVIILTYHYVFNLNLPESLNIDLNNSILIIDEAHNLPNVIIDINSFSISESTIKSSISDIKKYVENTELRNKALQILKNMLNYLKKFKERYGVDKLERSFTQIDINDVSMLFENIHVIKDAYFEVISKKRSQGVAIPYTALSKILDFHRKLTTSHTGYAIFLTCKEGILSITCKYLDPAIISSKIFSKAFGVVLMSGTLPPTNYVKSILGIERMIHEYRISFKHYIPEENIQCSIYTEVTTRYVERSEEMFEKIAQSLSKLYKGVKINRVILSIFPSYTVLKSVRKYLDPDIDYLMELSTTDIDQVLEELRCRKKKLLMVVAGGKLMEGVEFKIDNENLLGIVAIVGIPYPEPNDFLNLYMDIITSRIGSREFAWELTYLWNAVIKIKQAIGRAFRSENDKAYVLLMDRRFCEGKVYQMIKDYLGDVKIISDINRIINDVNSFFHFD